MSVLGPLKAYIQKTFQRPKPPPPPPPKTPPARTVGDDFEISRPTHSSPSHPLATAALAERAGQAGEEISGVLRRIAVTGTLSDIDGEKVEEQLALAKLPPEQRKQYADVQKSLEGHPSEQAAVRKMLLDGTLTTPSPRGGASVLDSLAELADPDTQVQPGVDRQGLLVSIVHDISEPDAIQQGDNSLCGATGVLAGMASDDPAEYARVATRLGVDGKVTLAGTHPSDSSRGGTYEKGDPIVLTLQPGSTATQGGSSSAAIGLLAPALNEYGNGEWASSDNAGNNRGLGPLPGQSGYDFSDASYSGAYPGNVRRMQSALYGTPIEAQWVNPPGSSGGDALAAAETTLQEQLDAGVTPMVLIDGHWMPVVSIDGSQVTTLGLDGTTHVHPLSDAVAITYDPNHSTPPPETQVPENVDPGGGWKQTDGAEDISGPSGPR